MTSARIAIQFGAALAFAGFAAAPALAGGASGVWLTENQKAHVEIAPCGDALCGRIVWLKEPLDAAGKPKLDKENPDAGARAKPLLGSAMIAGMKPDGTDRWAGGAIYNAEDGKTYTSTMALKDADTLTVAGCVWIFCKSQVWTRVR